MRRMGKSCPPFKNRNNVGVYIGCPAVLEDDVVKHCHLVKGYLEDIVEGRLFICDKGHLTAINGYCWTCGGLYPENDLIIFTLNHFLDSVYDLTYGRTVTNGYWVNFTLTKTKTKKDLLILINTTTKMLTCISDDDSFSHTLNEKTSRLIEETLLMNARR